MPAALDDPASPTIYRVSGQAPYPNPDMPQLPPDIVPRQVTLRDRQTVATIVPFASLHQVPHSLIVYLCDQFNKEIEGGDVYPMMDPFSADGFAKYWFQNFGAVMLLGSIEGAGAVVEGKDWSKECLGSFHIKPNYPGRSSHVCNAGFIVTDASRNRGVGRLMGETYIDYAPRLGYTYSMFNLVYETNVASCRIWDALGFKRIGRVKGAGNLKSHPGRLIDAIIYGRDMTPGEGEDLVSEERFDKIKFYLKYGKYPNGADRAEKSRLRSAATHYKLMDNDKLMLKDKEVISDPARQYDIARSVHVQQHGGINKTTATIAEKYHWSRIKETVSDVIRNCTECKDLGKMPSTAAAARKAAVTPSAVSSAGGLDSREQSTGLDANNSVAHNRVMGLQDHAHSIMPTLSQPSNASSPGGGYANPSDLSSIAPSHTLHSPAPGMNHHSHHNPMLHEQHHHHDAYQPIDPQIINQPGDNPFEQYHAHAADFQALLNATEGESDAAAVDRDLEMLIDHQDDDDVVGGGTSRNGDIMMGDGSKGDDKEREIYDSMGFEGAG